MAIESVLLLLLALGCFSLGLLLRLAAYGQSASYIWCSAAVTAGLSCLVLLASTTSTPLWSNSTTAYSSALSGLLASGFLAWYGSRLFFHKSSADWLLLFSIWLACCFVLWLNQAIDLSPRWPQQSAAFIGLMLLLFNLREWLRISKYGSSNFALMLTGLLFLAGLYRTAVIDTPGAHSGFSLGLYLAAVVLMITAVAMVHISSMRTQLGHLASRDQLTCALNRNGFYERAKLIHSIAQRDKRPAALVIVDVDYFRDINEKYGQKMGDKLLIHLVGIISSTFREQDLFARYGGEEFIALLPDTNAQQARVAMSRLQLNLANKPLKLADQDLIYTVSIGVCIGFCSEQSLEEMVISAEEAMQEAKFAGRDQVQIHQPDTSLSLVKNDNGIKAPKE